MGAGKKALGRKKQTPNNEKESSADYWQPKSL